MSKTDFDLSKIKGVVFDVDGVLSPATVPMNSEGIPQRMANLRDGFALKAAGESGLRLCILTGGNDPAIIKRYNGLGITDVIMVTGPKLPHLINWIRENSLSPKDIAYVGDDIPDIECMNYVGLAVAPSDASAEAVRAAYYVTDSKGGYGVARELLEQILMIQGKWPETGNSFGN